MDLIGDVGGLNEGLMLLIGVLITLLNFEKFQHYLIEHLFKKHDYSDGKGEPPPDKKTKHAKLKDLSVMKTSTWRQKFN